MRVCFLTHVICTSIVLEKAFRRNVDEEYLHGIELESLLYDQDDAKNNRKEGVQSFMISYRDKYQNEIMKTLRFIIYF